MSSTAGPLCVWADQEHAVRINSFALVTYIPHPLGDFLDGLRKELVPECSLRSHVSILPPRPLLQSNQAAQDQIETECTKTPRFRIEAGDIQVFPVTNVIYIAVVKGGEELRGMHDALNKTNLAFDEPYIYHPHITLAQQLPLDLVKEGSELARRRWAECPHQRWFEVEAITFVQNTTVNRWVDLLAIKMEPPPGPRR